MGFENAEPMTLLIDAAQRLRQVRAAYRRFLLLWALEKDRQTEDTTARRTRRRSKFPRNTRQLRLFDDL